VVDVIKSKLERNKNLKIGAYHPLPDEPDITPLFNLDHSWYLPRISDSEKKQMKFFHFHKNTQLQQGTYGIYEPEPDTELNEPLDVLLIPGLAFDLTGYRLGRGQGYYDRHIEDLSAKTVMGITFFRSNNRVSSI